MLLSTTGLIKELQDALIASTIMKTKMGYVLICRHHPWYVHVSLQRWRKDFMCIVCIMDWFGATLKGFKGFKRTLVLSCVASSPWILRKAVNEKIRVWSSKGSKCLSLSLPTGKVSHLLLKTLLRDSATCNRLFWRWTGNVKWKVLLKS